MTADGDAGDEIAVDLVHPVGDGGAIGGGKFSTGSIGAGIGGADSQLPGVNPEPGQGGADGELAAEHADGAGERAGLGHDGGGFRRYPIAAGRRIGSHGHHYRLFGRLGRAHRGQDLL